MFDVAESYHKFTKESDTARQKVVQHISCSEETQYYYQRVNYEDVVHVSPKEVRAQRSRIILFVEANAN